VREKVTGQKMPILQEVPIVTMQLNTINGVDKKANEKLPEEKNYSRWLYNREFRVTYRDTLISSEQLTDGALIPKGARGDSIFVSFEKGFGEGNGFKIGDEVEFNVQGRPIKTYIGSFREVKFNQVSTNFLVLFPDGVLEEAPKFHVIITKTSTDKQAAEMQAEMVREFPNISIINLGTIVETLEEILGKISFVIQFMAFFSIATGILVLISSLIISKYQRMRESILLRTLGASSALVRQINTLEYFFLGSLASLSGILLSFFATFLLGKFVFQMNFSLAWKEGLVIYLAITVLTIVLGWLNGRKIINQPPMEILRGNG
jgi:putative ABC transport system permease protein